MIKRVLSNNTLQAIKMQSAQIAALKKRVAILEAENERLRVAISKVPYADYSKKIT